VLPFWNDPYRVGADNVLPIRSSSREGNLFRVGIQIKILRREMEQQIPIAVLVLVFACIPDLPAR
jgi:hypothetical protein